MDSLIIVIGVVLGVVSSALALLGGANRTRRGDGPVEQGQATGATGRTLPEEFRAGLDTYFNRLEADGR